MSVRAQRRTGSKRAHRNLRMRREQALQIGTDPSSPTAAKSHKVTSDRGHAASEATHVDVASSSIFGAQIRHIEWAASIGHAQDLAIVHHRNAGFLGRPGISRLIAGGEAAAGDAVADAISRSNASAAAKPCSSPSGSSSWDTVGDADADGGIGSSGPVPGGLFLAMAANFASIAAICCSGLRAIRLAKRCKEAKLTFVVRASAAGSSTTTTSSSLAVPWAAYMSLCSIQHPYGVPVNPTINQIPVYTSKHAPSWHM